MLVLIAFESLDEAVQLWVRFLNVFLSARRDNLDKVMIPDDARHLYVMLFGELQLLDFVDASDYLQTCLLYNFILFVMFSEQVDTETVKKGQVFPLQFWLFKHFNGFLGIGCLFDYGSIHALRSDVAIF